jgi:hypothetical protein
MLAALWLVLLIGYYLYLLSNSLARRTRELVNDRAADRELENE